MSDNPVPGIETYDGAAGGWGALGAVARALSSQMALGRETFALHKVNQPSGFDCPGCAWPDPKETSSFEFCENGAKAVSWEATAKRVRPAFFAANRVADLWHLSDYALEGLGRLTHPLAYDADSDTYRPIAWDEAFRRIGEALRALPHPDMAEFYTSGRASNEAAFLYQLLAREYGTNNFPDCSNMCHEATSVGLPPSIGVGKGTVTLEDFEHCDAVFCIGHNPGTNHPRMLGTLREVSLRDVPIVVLNPLPERGLERFTSPQSPVEMLTGGSVRIASTYYTLKIGGDVAVLKGMMKTLLAADARALAAGETGVIDRDFIAAHTSGFDALVADLDRTSWEAIERNAGLTRTEIEAIAGIYARARNVIVCYGMGITQHAHGTENVQQIANLLLMRGNIGRRGAGICPLRGHSNVQGDRTVGITEKPGAALNEGLRKTYGFEPPTAHGHDAVAAVIAIREGRSKALIALGGNLAVAMPDTEETFAAMRRLDLAVHVATKLNRSHLLLAKQSFILPCLGRTERDEQATGPQAVTVEDSMSMVHASAGTLAPASEYLRSEPWIVAGIAKATLPRTKVDWDRLVGDYNLIRDDIEKVFPIFFDFNRRVSQPGGFRLRVAASDRVWETPDGRAHFLVARGLDEDPPLEADGLMLTTIRSHDQYNTTIYGLNDRYRGVSGRRDVVFMHPDDLAARGLKHGDRIDIHATGVNVADGKARAVLGVTAVAYGIARGAIAMYYPEGNALIALESHDRRSGTPAYKSVPVVVEPSREPQALRKPEVAHVV
ncbi:oxidoreductase alpha (molybdopterin) subunit [Luteibacter sp. UNCMF331Sha3.1]|uniref:FdhF/YdeP family oxidoreductase n=1 Tax=Luteibacter sp. UNCMF331Sha3.1 TaxID=1502760 RepID=UPI0008CA1754|nr:FdhF/YdeP family oxidoreductase [Luteibacter sp. UNCMF331Sha3.1]SEM38683.1 oxidoreductase alpha (molybdopterin) subunit [Luteibacter sp. UNCMF331Sha3.1]